MILEKKNLSENIIVLSQFIEDLKEIRLLNKDIDQMIDNLIVESGNLKKSLDNLKGKMDAIVSNSLKLDNHVSDEFIFANTQFEKISTEAKHWILPDVGLLYAFNADKDVLRPFLGVNINFGPVDKDVKTRYISGGSKIRGANRFGRFLRQHTSLMLGVTYGSLKIENERDDLFNSINVITGVGFRINRSIRISGGTLWYNQINPNPLISDKKTKAMGFFSLSFDIEFKNASGTNLNKLF